MAKRVVASYCTTFLKPEMLHIYRQVRSLHEFDTFVMTKAFPNIETVAISAAQSGGLDELKDRLERWLFEEAPAAESHSEATAPVVAVYE
ncbi:MAG: hypothetical protein DME97_04075 [Verrucomicrobia bacterium]|nr:MAG: hypothetical protein DME97_04075 [Verrucomicrobiota bacterium]